MADAMNYLRGILVEAFSKGRFREDLDIPSVRQERVEFRLGAPGEGAGKRCQ
jgi:hypothetical protein